MHLIGRLREVKMFELGSDNDFEMVRYMLAQRSFKKVASSHSGRLELARQTIQMWATVITAEKNWQMAASNPRMSDSKKVFALACEEHLRDAHRRVAT